MGLRSLAEGIIVQSMEDLWDESLREDCITFFRSEEFRMCAELAGMGLSEQMKLLDMVKEVLDRRQAKKRPEDGGNSNRNRKQTYQKWGTKELAPCR
jgi:hypothetical protein